MKKQLLKTFDIWLIMLNWIEYQMGKEKLYLNTHVIIEKQLCVATKTIVSHFSYQTL